MKILCVTFAGEYAEFQTYSQVSYFFTVISTRRADDLGTVASTVPLFLRATPTCKDHTSA